MVSCYGTHREALKAHAHLIQGEMLLTPGAITCFTFIPIYVWELQAPGRFCVLLSSKNFLPTSMYTHNLPIYLLHTYRCQADYLLCNLHAPGNWSTGMTETASVITSIKYFAENRTISRIYKRALSNSAFICLLIHVSALCQHETLVSTVHTCPSELQHNKIFILLPKKLHDSYQLYRFKTNEWLPLSHY